MKLSELQAHHRQYEEWLAAAKRFVAERDLNGVLSSCSDACSVIEGALRFVGKKPEFGPLDLYPLEALCTYAPAFFEHEILKRTHEQILGTRYLAKFEDGRLPAQIEAALQRQEQARLMWNVLRKNQTVPKQEFFKVCGAAQQCSESILDLWREFGIVRQEDSGFSLATDMTARFRGVCPQCSTQVRGQKGALLRPLICPRCKRQGYLHIAHD